MSNKNDLLDALTENAEDESYKVMEETANILNEKNVVKFDRQTAKKRLYTQAVLLSAKDANDPLYTKYVQASHKRRALRRKIQIKYSSKGMAKVREFTERRKAKSTKK